MVIVAKSNRYGYIICTSSCNNPPRLPWFAREPLQWVVGISRFEVALGTRSRGGRVEVSAVILPTCSSKLFLPARHCLRHPRHYLTKTKVHVSITIYRSYCRYSGASTVTLHCTTSASYRGTKLYGLCPSLVYQQHWLVESEQLGS